jgi:hypothetical protein
MQSGAENAIAPAAKHRSYLVTLKSIAFTLPMTRNTPMLSQRQNAIALAL